MYRIKASNNKFEYQQSLIFKGYSNKYEYKYGKR